MILDAGSKTLSEAGPPAGRPGFGSLPDHPEVEIIRLNEEHATCVLGEADGRFAVGDTVRVVPNHVCTCVNLHDRVIAVRAGRVEEVWAVAARGLVR